MSQGTNPVILSIHLAIRISTGTTTVRSKNNVLVRQNRSQHLPLIPIRKILTTLITMTLPCEDTTHTRQSKLKLLLSADLRKQTEKSLLKRNKFPENYSFGLV